MCVLVCSGGISSTVLLFPSIALLLDFGNPFCVVYSKVSLFSRKLIFRFVMGKHFMQCPEDGIYTCHEH